MDVFTHGVFVTNNQISKYLEAFFEKKALLVYSINFSAENKKKIRKIGQ